MHVPDCSFREAFAQMLEYVCFDDFTFSDIDESCDDEMLIELEWLADKYLLEGLGILCRHEREVLIKK